MDLRDEFHSGESSPSDAEPIQPGEIPFAQQPSSPLPPPIVQAGEYSTGVVNYARPIITAEWDAPPFPLMDQAQLPALLDLLAVVSLMIAFAAYTYATNLSEQIAEWVPSVGGLGWVFANGFVAMFAVTVVVLLRGQSHRSLGLCRSPWRRLLPVIMAAAPAAWVTGIACNLIYAVFQLMRGVTMESMMRHRLGFISAISEIDIRWVAPLSIFVGIYEEVFFRGFIMGRLASVTRSRVAAVILSSLLFGAVHFTQGWLGVFQTTCLGVVLALAAVMGRSLWAAILAHVAIDAISLAISVFMRGDILKMLRELSTTQAGQ